MLQVVNKLIASCEQTCCKSINLSGLLQLVSVLEDFGQPPNEVVLNESINAHVSAVNSQGEIFVKHSDDEIKIISRTGETKVVNLSTDKFVQLHC